MLIDMLIDADWCWLMLTGCAWCWLMLIDSDWCWLILIVADWFWLKLISADWCRLMLIDADSCWLVLIVADWAVWCWLMLTQSLTRFSFVGAYLRSFSGHFLICDDDDCAFLSLWSLAFRFDARYRNKVWHFIQQGRPIPHPLTHTFVSKWVEVAYKDEILKITNFHKPVPIWLLWYWKSEEICP